MQLIFFEDKGHHNFHPLTLTRPFDDLRLGLLTIREKWQHELNTTALFRKTRQYLKSIYSNNSPESCSGCLWVNPRFLPKRELIEAIGELDINEGLLYKDQVVAIYPEEELTHKWFQDPQLNSDAINYRKIYNAVELRHYSDLLDWNGAEITADIERLRPAFDEAEFISPRATIHHPERVYISKGAFIEPGAVLIAKDGPIYIGKNAHVMSGSFLRGPAAVGDNSVLKMGAKIYENTTIGPVCKIGGEVSNSIFHSYSNKAHDGFVGHSIVGQWCNFGADSNTSNLKNNYGSIKLFDWNSGESYDTGKQFFGTIMADHCMTSINCMLNTGTIIGVCCNVFTDRFPPKFIPSFSWVDADRVEIHRFDKAIEKMERMMSRRNVELTPEYHRMMQQLLVISQQNQMQAAGMNGDNGD